MTTGYIRCFQCGRDHSTKSVGNHSNYICDDCKRINREEGYRLREITRHQLPGDYVVVECPDGTFKKGAFFHHHDFMWTITLGHFPPGTILSWNGDRYTVVGRELKKQDLVKLEDSA